MQGLVHCIVPFKPYDWSSLNVDSLIMMALLEMLARLKQQTFNYIKYLFLLPTYLLLCSCIMLCYITFNTICQLVKSECTHREYFLGV